MKSSDVYIISSQRTPVAKAHRGAFANTRPDDLLVAVLRNCLEQLPIEPADIEDVIMGCAMPEAEQGLNVGRLVALMSGLPNTVPGMTINRYCSSGIQSVALAADRIKTRQGDCFVAGGLESMSLIPMGGHHIAPNPLWFEQNELLGLAYGMGITAEKVAERFGISREDQDQFAYESHQRAIAAWKAGHFQAEVVPISVTERRPNLESGQIEETVSLISQDEGPRADTSLEALAKLKPAFSKSGSVTAGNSSQMSDGAAAAILVSGQYLKDNQLAPLARFCGYAVCGVPPEIMGIGPVEAIRKVLAQNNISLNQVDWIELNEAFAAQSLAVIRELDMDPARVNPLGGAIALGHPLGATGAIRLATAIHGLRRIRKRYGLITMCIGSGMGFAALIEVV